jgi:hypothetical protein
LNDGSPAGLVAYVALLLCIPFTALAFATMRPARAAVVVVLGAAMFLPEQAWFKFPLMPRYDKHNIPYICIFFACLFRCPRRVLSLPKERWFVVLTAVLLSGAVLTALANDDALRYGTYRVVVLPPLNAKDGFFTGISQTLHASLPFFLGAALFRSSRQLRDLLAGFVVAGLFYIPFAAIEMRMSPQLHNWVYGYHQHSFLQTMRWGGYRPMAFMAHGLALARFFVVGAMAAVVIAPLRRSILGLPSRWISIVLLVTVLLCRSTGAVAYGVFGLSVLFLGRVRARQAIAVLLAAIVLLYPALRASDLVPVSRILEAAGMVNSDREQSLLFRFENEDHLLAKTRERLVFGWGEYNRGLLFDEQGRPSSVTDGHWIVMLGMLGVVGFCAAFGMLLLPVFIARRRLRAIDDKGDRLLVAGTSLILAMVAVDLLPNGLWDDYPYLLAGALSGVSRALALAPKKRPARGELATRAVEGVAVAT